VLELKACKTNCESVSSQTFQKPLAAATSIASIAALS